MLHLALLFGLIFVLGYGEREFERMDDRARRLQRPSWYRRLWDTHIKHLSMRDAWWTFMG